MFSLSPFTTSNTLFVLLNHFLYFSFLRSLFYSQVIIKPALPETLVGRFTVSRTEDESAEAGQARPPQAAANGAPGSDAKRRPASYTERQNSITSCHSQNNRTSSASSDDDSEFEDEAFKMEVIRLREK